MYQGLSRGDLRATVDKLHTLMIGREPDLTILIDMDPATGLDRALARQTKDERFEAFGEELQVMMRDGFLALAEEFADRFRVIDGARDVDAVAVDVLAVVSGALE